MAINTDRFWSNANLAAYDACWNWTGHTARDNYARYGGAQASRVAYELAVGPIPAGLEIDHTCRNVACVNPAHLEPVTRLENMRRRFALYTHCVNGHEFTAENTYVKPDGFRDCRTCIRARVAAYRARKLARESEQAAA